MKLKIHIGNNIKEHNIYGDLNHIYYLLDSKGCILSTTDKRFKKISKLSYISGKILDLYYKKHGKYPSYVYGQENEVFGFLNIRDKPTINNIIIPDNI